MILTIPTTAIDPAFEGTVVAFAVLFEAMRLATIATGRLQIAGSAGESFGIAFENHAASGFNFLRHFRLVVAVTALARVAASLGAAKTLTIKLETLGFAARTTCRSLDLQMFKAVHVFGYLKTVGIVTVAAVTAIAIVGCFRYRKAVVAGRLVAVTHPTV